MTISSLAVAGECPHGLLDGLTVGALLARCAGFHPGKLTSTTSVAKHTP